ncbi:MAG: KEOPS complex subunit Pcc1 [Halobacteria archaeon]
MEIEFRHGNPDEVARCLEPDNTEEMETYVEGERVVTRIEREEIGSLRSTADDYVKNLVLAIEMFSE